MLTFFSEKNFAITDETSYEYLIELRYLKSGDLDAEGALSGEKLNALKKQTGKQL